MTTTTYHLTTTEQRVIHNALRDAYLAEDRSGQTDTPEVIFETMRHIDNPSMTPSVVVR